ncbi:MAG: hypothetical protein EOO66_03560 [Methylobacterium sp.]|nr:MAG: hypothetical protein EOO66_03560 [Methylobacterium sp.]
MILSTRPGVTALTLLRQSSAPTSAGTPDLIRTRLPSPSEEPGTRRTEAEASAALFGVNQPNPLKEMVAFLNRVGQVFGIERGAYATQSSFMAAVEDAFTALKADPDDPNRVDDFARRLHLDADTVAVLKQEKTADMLVGLIEKALGLDRLGLSLATVIKAGNNLDSAEADAMRTVLFRQAQEAQGRNTWDDLGLYQPADPVRRAAA